MVGRIPALSRGLFERQRLRVRTLQDRFELVGGATEGGSAANFGAMDLFRGGGRSHALRFHDRLRHSGAILGHTRFQSR